MHHRCVTVVISNPLALCENITKNNIACNTSIPINHCCYAKRTKPMETRQPGARNNIAKNVTVDDQRFMIHRLGICLQGSMVM